MKTHKIQRLLTIIVFGLFTSFALNAAIDLGIRALSLGGAYRAVGTGNDSIYYNSASLSIPQRYDLATDYIYDFKSRQHNIGASIVDSSTSLVTAGIAYNLGIDARAKENTYAHLGSMSLSATVWEQSLFVGALVKYAHMPKITSDEKVSQFNMDAGLLFRSSIGLSIAAAGYNLILTDSKRLPMSLGFGAAFSNSQNSDPNGLTGLFTVALDWLMLMDDLQVDAEIIHSLHGGGEFVVVKYFPLRAGYSYNLLEESHEMSVGAGAVSNQAGIELFYRFGLKKSKASVGGILVNLYL